MATVFLLTDASKAVFAVTAAPCAEPTSLPASEAVSNTPSAAALSLLPDLLRVSFAFSFENMLFFFFPPSDAVAVLIDAPPSLVLPASLAVISLAALSKRGRVGRGLASLALALVTLLLLEVDVRENILPNIFFAPLAAFFSAPFFGFTEPSSDPTSVVPIDGTVRADISTAALSVVDRVIGSCLDSPCSVSLSSSKLLANNCTALLEEPGWAPLRFNSAWSFSSLSSSSSKLLYIYLCLVPSVCSVAPAVTLSLPLSISKPRSSSALRVLLIDNSCSGAELIELSSKSISKTREEFSFALVLLPETRPPVLIPEYCLADVLPPVLVMLMSPISSLVTEVSSHCRRTLMFLFKGTLRIDVVVAAVSVCELRCSVDFTCAEPDKFSSSTSLSSSCSSA